MRNWLNFCRNSIVILAKGHWKVVLCGTWIIEITLSTMYFIINVRWKKIVSSNYSRAAVANQCTRKPLALQKHSPSGKCFLKKIKCKKPHNFQPWWLRGYSNNNVQTQFQSLLPVDPIPLGETIPAISMISMYICCKQLHLVKLSVTF